MRRSHSFALSLSVFALWVQGELVGGCDIVTEMYSSGELKPLVEAAAQAAAPEGEDGAA